ncbi:prepilin-type N-terminal cleavage/methylation domain-containing protein [Lysinibacillus sp. KU-BSD001]|uniref:pilus assembly FimT family protein n=1 Tax=Lysinibacillus sp. KU-BSD001 TaxID=3141328 RepID=UPI0036E407C6
MMKKLFRDDRGLSLLEVVASIVIIAIVCISFFSLLVQTNKTKVASSNTVDLTYYAQTELENIYTVTSNNINTPISTFSYGPDISTVPDKKIFTKTDNNMTYQMTLKQISGNNELTGVIIEIKLNNGNASPAKMETIMRWKVF